MTTSELALNVVVLFLVLYRNLGAHPVNLRRCTIPAAIIVVVGIIFLRHPPRAGNDTGFEAVGGLPTFTPARSPGGLSPTKITGSDAFTAMFVLMALAMIAAMMVTLAARTARFGHDPAAHAALAAS
jgi:hypothetical protein